MEDTEKNELVRRVDELKSELDGFREALQAPGPNADDANNPDTSADRSTEDQAVVVSISKRNGLEVSEEDIASLRSCARIKGLVVGSVTENPEPQDS